MGQGEILKAMEGKQWLSMKEIGNLTDSGQSSTSLCLLKLLKQNLVMRKEVSHNEVLITTKYKYKFYLYKICDVLNG